MPPSTTRTIYGIKIPLTLPVQIFSLLHKTMLPLQLEHLIAEVAPQLLPTIQDPVGNDRDSVTQILDM